MASLPNKEYWIKRTEQLKDFEYKKVDSFERDIVKEYERALSDVNSQVDAFYARYLNEPYSYLSAKDVEELKEQVKDNLKIGNRFKITRLESLQYEIENILATMATDVEYKSTDFYSDLYTDTYYRGIYEIQKGLDAVYSFSKVDERIIDKALSTKWVDSGNYSSRIWDDTAKLSNKLVTYISQQAILGTDIRTVSNQIAHDFDASKKNAFRLAQTESSYFIEKATYDDYEESEIEEYEILATLDLKTSNICQDMDGKTFDLEKAVTGTNYPPFHPHCRTTTIPVVDNAVLNNIVSTRKARDPETGKSYNVPDDWNYETWYNEHVEKRGE